MTVNVDYTFDIDESNYDEAIVDIEESISLQLQSILLAIGYTNIYGSTEVIK